jgi:hypothetical protein
MLPQCLPAQDGPAAVKARCPHNRQDGASDDRSAMRTASWTTLPEDLQLVLSREALRRAAETLAEHALMLAEEMERGTLTDRGGPDALRLFAAVVRATNEEGLGAVGHA